jgi:GAF domain-containing protein/HAMP domain-containing protein
LLAQEQNSDAFRVGQGIVDNITDATVDEAFVVALRNGIVNFEVVRVIEDNTEVAGFFVADLNLTELVLQNLSSTNPDYPTYSFMVMPDGVNTIQLLDVRRQRLVDTNSLAVERALNGQVAGTLIYNVGENKDRTVIGYYTTIDFLDTRLALITEIDQNVIQFDRVRYLSGVGFPIVIGLVGLLVVLWLLLNQWITNPVSQLRVAVRGMTRGSFDVPVPYTERNDELGDLSTAFVDMRQQTERLLNDMRQRLEERTRDVRLTQDISRAALAERDLQILMSKVINLITENFPNIYHAQIFLVDDEGEEAILRASTGRAGQELLQRGHRLPVGSVSVIGQVTEQGQMIIARDIGASNVHRQNEFLRETQSELAIPMMLGTQIVGALDVQSRERNSFTEDQISALQTLADQVTIAIENARLYEQSQRLVQTLEKEKQDRTRRAWQDVFNSLRTPSLSARYGNMTNYDIAVLREAVLKGNRSVVGAKTERNTIPFGVPVTVRGQVLGVVEFEIREADFNYNKVLLAEELTARLAISLDNARLFQDSARTAEREHLVNDISTKLTAQTDIQDIVETAIREVSAALGTPQVAVRFDIGQAAPPPNAAASNEPPPQASNPNITHVEPVLNTTPQATEGTD